MQYAHSERCDIPVTVTQVLNVILIGAVQTLKRFDDWNNVCMKRKV
jgi:hypothetical protein